MAILARFLDSDSNEFRIMKRSLLIHCLIAAITLIIIPDSFSENADILTAFESQFTAGKYRGNDSRYKQLNFDNLPRRALLDDREIPPNDSCRQAQIISGPFPVSGTGTTIDATIDCPTLLLWEGVWYKISLPYEYNDITLTICGLSGNLLDAGIVLMDDCECDNLIGASDFNFLDTSLCATGHNGIEIIFNSVPDNLNDESVVFWPVYAINDSSNNMDFVYTVNINQGDPPLPGDDCTNPFIIESLPFSDSLNSCSYNDDYNFSGEDIVYEMIIESCMIVDISLCSTEPIIDSYLLLYEENDCGGTPIIYDDDSCMPPGQYGTSRIQDTLEAGLYYIVVDAYGGECGEYILEVSGEPCTVYGACCQDFVCIGTMTEAECDSAEGIWYEAEDCDSGFNCPGNCFAYLAGDANMFIGAWPPQIIGSDVTYLVNFFRGTQGIESCLLGGFWGSADANGDCNIIGSDVTRLVNYFRGIGDILYCQEFPPCWIISEDLPDQMPVGWPHCENLR